MYAIVRSGGKQYRVREKQVFSVEKLVVEDGETVELTDVLLVADGDSLKVGTPVVEGAKVTATVLSTEKGKKVKGYTFKPKKDEKKRYGHRQWHTTLRVTKIE